MGPGLPHEKSKTGKTKTGFAGLFTGNHMGIRTELERLERSVRIPTVTKTLPDHRDGYLRRYLSIFDADATFPTTCPISTFRLAQLTAHSICRRRKFGVPKGIRTPVAAVKEPTRRFRSSPFLST